MKNPFEEYPVIAFKDIQKGDTLAWVPKYNDTDFQNASIGEAHTLLDSKSTPSWRTKDNWVVAWDEADSKVYLLDRPKPELPAEAGAVIFIKQFNGVVLDKPLVSVLDQYGDWFIPNGDDNSAVNKVWLVGHTDKAMVQVWALADLKEVTA